MNPLPPEPAATDILKQMLAELRKLVALVDDFAGAYLDAQFPHGRPADRWARR